MASRVLAAAAVAFALTLILPSALGQGNQEQAMALLNASAIWNPFSGLEESWVYGTDPCADPPWLGITCYDTGGPRGVSIRALVLSAMSLDGPLPGTWPLFLPDLTQLSISSTQITGSLPPEWSKFSNLEVLRLNDNILTGVIPNEWATLKTLSELSLGNNKLGGPLPTAWYLPDTDIFDVSDNNLTGTIPDNYGTFGLALFNVTGNTALCGPIPIGQMQNIVFNHTSVTTDCPSPPPMPSPPAAPLGLTGVALILMDTVEMWEGPATMSDWGMHEDYCRWSNVECLNGNISSIDLSESAIVGTLPVEWSKLSSLTSINLENNKIEGPLPASWSTLVSLQELSLGSNNIKDTLPVGWSALTSLSLLDMRSNYISGTIPPEYGEEMTHMQVLDMCDNNLVDGLPAFKAPLLTGLHLCNNSLSGTLPDQWSELNNLVLLEMDDNQLAGDLPAVWSKLVNLHLIGIGSNRISGSFPPTWGSMTTLTLVQVSNNNGMCGELPSDWLLHSVNFTVLYANTGIGAACSETTPVEAPYSDLPPPAELAETPPAPPVDNPTTLLLLEGAGMWPGAAKYLPTWSGHTSHCTWAGILCGDDGTSVMRIELKSMVLGGALPNAWSQLASVTHISFISTGITGELPSSWSALANLQHLALGPKNALEGSLPPEYSALSDLSLLDVSDNQLTGSYPSAYSALMNLTQVAVNENMLTGPYPTYPVGGDKLRILELFKNEFSGTLPAEWSKYESLNALYVGYSPNTTGGLPPAWGNSFTRLQVLDVSNSPGLSGTIPRSFAKMASLYIFTVYESAGLCGALPKWIANPPPQELIDGTLLNQSCPAPPTVAAASPRPPLPPTSRKMPPTQPSNLGEQGSSSSPSSPPVVADANGLSGGAVFAIVIGVLLILALVAACAMCVAKRRGFEFKHWREILPSGWGGASKSNYHSFGGQHETSRIIGMASDNDLYPAPAPVGGWGQHSRGTRARGIGSSISPFVENLLNAKGSRSVPPQEHTGVQLSHHQGNVF